MRTFHSKGSTTGRPFFTDDEMERTATEELRAVELLPASPQAIRVERFVEKRFGKCIQYEPLDRGGLGDWRAVRRQRNNAAAPILTSPRRRSTDPG